MADERQSLRPAAEEARQKKEERARAARRRNRQLIGLALAVLIIVGAVSTVSGLISLGLGLFDTSGEAEEYKTRFEPIVWFELIPFESIAQMDENSLKQVAIWGALSKQQDNVNRNERGEPFVSSAAVDLYSVELFGPNFRFSTHETFYDPGFDLRYTYDAAVGTYTIPSTGLQPNYVPTVVEIVRESGGVKRVVVGYVATHTGGNQIVNTPDLEHPAFYMDFMLQRSGSEFYLFALRRNTTYTPATPGAPGSSSVSLPQGSSSLPAGDDSGAPSQGA